MTGHGEGHSEKSGLSAWVELRAVNNRYFKLSLRGGEAYNALESHVESVVRESVRRGSLQVGLRLSRESDPDDFRLNAVALLSYHRQIEAAGQRLHLSDPVRLELLAALPGVIDESGAKSDQFEADWPAIEGALRAALTRLAQMRAEEGRAMAADLLANASEIRQNLAEVETRAPLVGDGYRVRLAERMRRMLAETTARWEEADLLREVAMFAERSDISEEIVRLRSHLDQFAECVELPESSGRKLDFITQEMFREANTIGSKASDPAISKQVIDIKAAIERMREMIQNVE
jgi:uncharacterized protein (TIGR00255 family)